MARRRKDEPQINWSEIYGEWRAGGSSIRMIARKHGISPTSINNKIAKENWTMDGPASYADLTPDEPDDIEDFTPDTKGNKVVQTKALLKHAKGLAQRMLSEVENVTSNFNEITQIINETETDYRRRQAMHKAISIETRAKTLKDIVTSIKMIEEAPAKAAKAAAAADKAPEGKKAQKQAEAEKVAAGRFAARPGPPKLVVNG